MPSTMIPGPMKRQQKGNSQVIRSIRSLRVIVIHQRDREGEELLRQLNRIGCQTDAVWPLPRDLPVHVDVVFLAINDKMPLSTHDLLEGGRLRRPTVIGLVDYENPSVLQMVLDLRVHAVLTNPLRPFGVLTSLVVARKVWAEEVRYENELAKLDEKLQNVRKVAQAKLILMRMHGVTENEAYAIIRRHAMSRRTTTAEIATSIIDADDILSDAARRG